MTPNEYYVGFTEHAEYDLEDILIFISNISPNLVFEFKNILSKKLILLKQFPRMYSKILDPKYPKKEYRRFVIDKYIFIYSIENKLIKIERVLFSKSDTYFYA